MKNLKNHDVSIGEESIPREIERKFLVKFIPENLEEYPHEHVSQGYLAITEDGTEVRLRKKGNKYFQTIKSGKGKIRTEVEIEITEQQFVSLWDITEDKRLEKFRYKIFYRDNTIELDIYKEDLKGLVTAEIEFDCEETSEKFVAPEWLRQEVTESEEYKNKNLVIYGIPENYEKFKPAK